MKLKYYIICLGLLFLASCSKDLEVSKAPDFNVTTEANTFKVNEPVTFKFTGGADNISFYSGKPSNDYAFKDGRVIELGNVGATMVFTSSVQLGAQANQLTVLASNDFDGNYESLESVKEATWVDITSRFALGTSTTFLNSGEKDISDLIVDGKPIYIAFKYLTRPQVDNGFVRTWMIQTFNIKSKELYNDQNVSIIDQTSAGFRIVDQDPVNTPARSLVTATRVTLQGNIYKDPTDPIYDPENPIYDPENPIYDRESELYNPDAVLPIFVPYDPASPYNDPQRENWAVSAPIHLDIVNLGPDLSIPIRGIRSTLLENYTYTYDKPGTYKVYFVASNNTVDQQKEVIRSIDITIVE